MGKWILKIYKVPEMLKKCTTDRVNTFLLKKKKWIQNAYPYKCRTQDEMRGDDLEKNFSLFITTAFFYSSVYTKHAITDKNKTKIWVLHPLNHNL